jgi:glucan phosphoethanolaminetransferase (alkaline phosphatase superfamily)
MEINRVPLHPLVVHAAVVFVPLAALAAVLFAVPKWRWLLRWPALVLAVGASVAVQLASMSGEDLEHDRHLDSALVHTHQEYADQLRIAMFVLTLLVIVAFWALGHVTALRDRADRQAKVAALEKPMVVLLPVLAVVVLVLVFLTGDAGARAVWKG